MLTDEEFRGFLKLLGRRIRAIRKDKNLTMRDIMIASGYYDASGESMKAEAALPWSL